MAQRLVDQVDVLEAASLTGRSAETIRRWVWSGRLKADKRGNKILIARRDLEALVGPTGLRCAMSLGDWLKRLERSGLKEEATEASVSNLVLDDRRIRS